MECYCKNPLLTAKDINENICVEIRQGDYSLRSLRQGDEKIQKRDNLVLTHVKDNIYTLNGEYYTYTKCGIIKRKMSQYNEQYNIFSYRYNGVNKKFKVKTIYNNELTNIIQF